MVVLWTDAAWIARELVERLEAEIKDLEHELCCGELYGWHRLEAQDELNELRRLMTKAKEIADSE